MATFLAQRTLAIIPVMLGVSIVMFLMIKLVPGDPVDVILGARATEESRAQVRQSLRLDQPWHIQYWEWLTRAVQGDFGRSIALRTQVTPVLLPKIGNTMILAAGSLVICIVIGLLAGLLAGTRQYSFIDRFAMFGALAGASVPPFWLGLVLMSVFALNLGWLPATGMHTTGDDSFLDLLRHLILPAVTTATVSTAVIARITRSSIISIMQQEYVKLLRAKGLSERQVVLKHALRNALPPLVTIVGLQVGYLMGGAVFVETVFNWPGIGLQLKDSIVARDLPMIQAAVLLVAFTFVLVNLVADTIIAWLDPRVR